MRYRILLLALLGFAMLMPSCTKEKLTPSGEDATTFKIATRALNENAPDPDFRISTLRVMAFDKASGNVRSNKLYSDAELTGNPISHTMYTGTYDFVFVGNEPASLTTALNGVVRASELSGAGFSIPASAFGSTLSIPMVLRVDNVTVLADDAGVSIDGGAAQKPWNVAIERIGILIEDIVLTSKNDLTGATITSVKFSNIPNSVPLMTGGNYPGGLTFRASSFSSFPSGVTVGEPEKSLYGIPIANSAMSFVPPRIILPHNEFTPAANADRAISMELVTSKGTFNYKVGLDPETDYTLPRNCKYRLICAIDPSGLEVHLQATGWTDQNVNGDPLNRILNVSAVETTVSTISRARIYFWSNQPAVSVETQGRTSTDGTTWASTYSVSGIFEGLGNGGANISYNATTGTGYIDIAANLANTAATGTYYRSVVINAGGLKREIRVKFNHMKPAWNIYYVGTFHRKNQTGERIVYMTNTGAWTATADESFVRLSTLRSQDNTTLTDNPDDAEKYQVEGNAQTVSGTGVIYFRVGMTGTTASNRYAKIEIAYNGDQKKYIYVRQGEDADYLMRPNDPGTDVGGRALAVKFSPYNLTAPAFNGGGTSATQRVDVGARGGVPTDYPTQAGAFFLWAHTDGVIAYNAAIPNTTTPTMWGPSNTVSDYWDNNNIGKTYESCPPGYRRPTDGITNGDQNLPIAANSSEMFQSLFLNPPTDLTGNTDNVVWGYYADGFFDRRIIGTQTASTANQPNTAVAIDNSTVAYVGELFYNQYNDASLFLPASGSRSAVTGYLHNTGHYGYYWSASSSGNSSGASTAFYLSFSNVHAFRDATSRHYGFSVRCVLAE